MSVEKDGMYYIISHEDVLFSFPFPFVPYTCSNLKRFLVAWILFAGSSRRVRLSCPHIACLALFVMGNQLYMIQNMLHRSHGLKCNKCGVWLIHGM